MTILTALCSKLRFMIELTSTLDNFALLLLNDRQAVLVSD